MPRALSEEEKAKLERKRAMEEQIIHERMPVLAEFAAALGLNEPAMIVADAERYLPSIDVYMRDQVIEEEDRVWIITRLGYLIGEVLLQRLGGRWFLNENPDSRTFLCFVVGEFTRIKNRSAMVDPFGVADEFVSEPIGRNLYQLVREVEDALVAA